jgi:hypothetical protein
MTTAETKTPPLLTIEFPNGDGIRWSDGQECFTASRWYGEVLVHFLSKTAVGRLDNEENIQRTGAEVLRRVSESLGAPTGTIMTEEEMLGNLFAQLHHYCPIVNVYWSDYEPPLLMASVVSVCIPTDVENNDI